MKALYNTTSNDICGRTLSCSIIDIASQKQKKYFRSIYIYVND